MLYRSSDYYEKNEEMLAEIVHFHPDAAYYVEANPVDRYSSIVRVGSTRNGFEIEISNEFLEKIQFETDVEFRFIDWAA